MNTASLRRLLIFVLAALCWPQIASAQVCIAAGENCTANDLTVHTIAILPSSPDQTCTDAGDTVTLDLQSQMQPHASTRYDVATLISLDGGPVVGGSSCLAQELTPVDEANANPAVGGVGPYRERDGDACGDIRNSDGVTLNNLPQQTIPCSDSDANGFLDISTCWLWVQNASDVICNSVNDLLVGTTAKCFCDAIQIPITVPPGPLPVELTDFSVILSDTQAELTWTTATETDNAGFDVEHALPGQDFSKIGFVEGHGTTNEAQSYTFTIAELIPGRHVFRLKQVDYDGTFTYSFAIEAIVDMPDAYYLSNAYPNPFNPQAVVQFAVEQSQAVTLGLYTVNGQFVQSIYHGVPPAGQTQTVRIDGTGLSSGVYMLQFVGEKFQTSKQVVLTK